MNNKVKFSKTTSTKQNRILIAISILLILSLFISHLAMVPKKDQSIETLSKLGSRGDEVKTIQTKLIRWGYMKGKADGIFGAITLEGVKYFQRKNGLVVDGIVGPATLKALGMFSSNSSSSSTADINLLARLISAEARGEPYTGQVAVGAVVLNRMEHPGFPDTMSGVIYQKGAFSCLNDGQWNKPVVESAYRAAKEALNGADPSYGATYYYNPKTATNKWI